MTGSGIRTGAGRYRLIAAVAVIVGILLARPAVAQSDPDDFFGWLFALLWADEVPTPPTLEPEDREAILKVEVLLEDSNRRAEAAGNYMLLGILAAARRDKDAAKAHFERAAELDDKSVLALTALGQTMLQEGSPEEAIEWHKRALAKADEPGTHAGLARVNSHLDLAVAYTELAKKIANVDKRKAAETEARRQAGLATRELEGGDLRQTEKGLGYLQAGIVAGRVLKDESAATRAWTEGSRLLEARRLEPLDARLTVQLKVNLANQSQPPAKALRYLREAGEAARDLPVEYSARAQVAQAHVQVIEKMHEVPPEATMQMVRVREKMEQQKAQRPDDLKALRDLMQLEAKMKSKKSPDEAKRLEKKADRVQVELRERVYQQLQLRGFDMRQQGPPRLLQPARPVPLGVLDKTKEK